jgi:hypothetical protein
MYTYYNFTRQINVESSYKEIDKSAHDIKKCIRYNYGFSVSISREFLVA